MIRAAILSLLLAGCASQTAIQRVEVPVPVVKPCLTAADIPREPISHMIPGVNVERLAAAASADLRELTIYSARLRAMLLVCAETPPER